MLQPVTNRCDYTSLSAHIMSSTVPPPHHDTQTLLHQTTVTLSQVQNLLRQATDIIAHLHTHFLHHIRQADPTFRQHFQPLPPPPIHPIHLLLRFSTLQTTYPLATTTLQRLRRHTFTYPNPTTCYNPQAKAASTTTT